MFVKINSILSSLSFLCSSLQLFLIQWDVQKNLCRMIESAHNLCQQPTNTILNNKMYLVTQCFRQYVINLYILLRHEKVFRRHNDIIIGNANTNLFAVLLLFTTRS